MSEQQTGQPWWTGLPYDVEPATDTQLANVVRNGLRPGRGSRVLLPWPLMLRVLRRVAVRETQTEPVAKGSLRERYAEAIANGWWCDCLDDHNPPGMTVEHHQADAVLAVRDDEVERLRAEVDRLKRQERGQTTAAKTAWRAADASRERAKAAEADNRARRAASEDLHDRGAKPGYQEWRCERCRGVKWVGWAAGPGMPRRAQCVPCGHVQALPEPASEVRP